MKAKELRTLTQSDLEKKREELYKELMKDRAQIAIGTAPKNPGNVRVMKKTIAKINTIITELSRKAVTSDKQDAAASKEVAK
jgi:large subunit ribosomal protein L29